MYWLSPHWHVVFVSSGIKPGSPVKTGSRPLMRMVFLEGLLAKGKHLLAVCWFRLFLRSIQFETAVDSSSLCIVDLKATEIVL